MKKTATFDINSLASLLTNGTSATELKEEFTKALAAANEKILAESKHKKELAAAQKFLNEFMTFFKVLFPELPSEAFDALDAEDFLASIKKDYSKAAKSLGDLASMDKDLARFLRQIL